jgi:hypothetical protein
MSHLFIMLTGRQPSISASVVKDLSYVVSLFGLDYDEKAEVCGWDVPEIQDVSLSLPI